MNAVFALFLVSVSFGFTVSEYWTVTVKTCDSDKAGTGASMEITIYGLKGTTKQSLHGSYERGDTDVTRFSTATLGKPYKIAYHQGSGGWFISFNGWCMDWVKLSSSAGTFNFVCKSDCWFDGSTKEFLPSECDDGDPIPHCVSKRRVHCFLSTCNRCSSQYRAYGGSCHECNNRYPIPHCHSYASCDDKLCSKCEDGFYLSNYKHECHACTHLPDCAVTLCTSASKRWCTKCRDPELFKLDSSGLCSRKCSWEDRWCWPGRCDKEYASNCECAPGFSSVKSDKAARCEPNLKANISTCIMQMQSSRGVMRSNFKGSSACKDHIDIYGNFQVQKIILNTMISYVYGVDKARFPKPQYIGDYMIGVTDVQFDVVKVLKNDDEKVLKTQNIKNDSMRPVTDYNKTVEMKNITAWTNSRLSNGDRICVRIITKGGGFFESINLNTPDHRHNNVSFPTVNNQRDLCYFFDDASPKHCSEGSKCSKEPLELSRRITRSRTIEVSFSGWVDPSPVIGNKMFASGIKQYEITFYEVEKSGLLDLKRNDKKIVSLISNTSEPVRWTVPQHLPNPALYAAVLEVTDAASNSHQARRFFLYDNCSQIETRDKHKIITVTATKETSYRWQIDHKAICFNWTNHFYNDKYTVPNLLMPIKPDAYEKIRQRYDQISGKLAVSGTTNIDGITSFTYTLKRNGITIIAQFKMENFTRQKSCFPVLSSDGDTFSLIIEAQDIVNNTLNDSVEVYIDSTVPEISNVWLVRDKFKRLYVHHSTELSTMTLAFDALDPHSGLFMVMWKFGTTNGGAEIAYGTLSVKNIISCNTTMNSNCYCPSVGDCQFFNYTVELKKLAGITKGLHNRRYFFKLEVTNQALLKTIEHIDVLVDDSPPAVGVVFEGSVGSPDIDYTSDDTTIAHWHGFIDHESGIKSYVVGIGNRCLRQDELQHRNLSHSEFFIKETIESSVKLPLNNKGRHYVTVIAYNNAMEPSAAVCSDGIIKDNSPPSFRNVTLQSASTAETILCSNEIAWLIHGNVSTVRLVNTSTCFKRCKLSSGNAFLTLLPLDYMRNLDLDISDFLCERLTNYNDTLIYLPRDKIEFTWDIEEDFSQIHSIYIGFGSAEDSKDLPDMIGYEKVEHTSLFRKHHIGINHGTEFYAFLKIANKAGLESISTYGPIIVDETPPVCPDYVRVDVDDNYATIMLHAGLFTESEQREEIGSIFFRIGSETSYHTTFLQWNINQSPTCNGKIHCIMYPISKLQRFDGTGGAEFYFDLHVYNYAGHYCAVRSERFKIASRVPPPRVTVIDLNPETVNTALTFEDTDVVISNGIYCAALKGHSFHLNVTFKIGLGSTKLSDDVVQFHQFNQASRYYCQNITELQEFKRYFVSVRSVCSGGTRISSSNGFVVVNPKHILKSLHVFDGEGCYKQSVVDNAKVIKGNDSFLVIQNLNPFFVGKPYTLEFNSFGVNMSVESDDVLDMKVVVDANVASLTFNPMKEIARIYVRDLRDTNVSINPTFSPCISDDVVLSYQDEIWTNWRIDDAFGSLITHFELQLLRFKNVSTSDFSVVFIERSVDPKLTQFKYGIKIDREGYYSTLIKPCIANICLEGVMSSGFIITNNEPLAGYALAKMKKKNLDCLSVNLSLDSFKCSFGDTAAWYRWALFKRKLSTPLSHWSYIKVGNIKQNVTIKDQKCVENPLHQHATTLICVDGYCLSGGSKRICVPVITDENPNAFNKETLYEINADDKNFKNIQNEIFSINLGNRLEDLHNMELDFSSSKVTLGGIIIGLENRNVTWYVLTKPSISKGFRCFDDPKCVTSRKTVGGYVRFPQSSLIEGNIYYVCAQVSSSMFSREKDREHVSEFSTCGNGISIDNSAPSKGVVRIISNGGYVTQKGRIGIEWSKFHDAGNAESLGYPSDIASFYYSVGTYPFGNDVINSTNVGLSNNILIDTILFKLGGIYYATVTAVDYAQHSASVTSDGVTYDTTPPVAGEVTVGTSNAHYFVTSDSVLFVFWKNFRDNESGIKDIKVGIGTTPFSADVIPYVTYGGDFAQLQRTKSLHDGYRYYAVLKVTNRAGLTNQVSSDVFRFDSSPPDIGVVEDGLLNNESDVDYQLNTTHIGCHWKRFSDPHSDIEYYKVGLGTQSMEDNVIVLTDIGLKTDIFFSLNFFPGVRYFCQVQACNGAGLCARQTSDGVTIDNSPPIAGLVHVGTTGSHSKYIAHTSVLQARWIGFQDPHSDISHFLVCIGKHHNEKQSCDILQFTNVLLASSITKTQLSMPENTPLHIIVKAFNKVGLFVETMSDSFVVITRPPTIKVRPLFDVNNTFASHNAETQFDVSQMKLNWEFEDITCPIIRQSVSLRTHHDGHTPVESVEVQSASELFVVLNPENWLHNGDTYQAFVTACNQAGLCTTSSSPNLIIDSTPPHLGGFKPPLWWSNVRTNSSISTTVLVTWYGFVDVESGIKTYFVTIGDSYSGNELSDIVKVSANNMSTTDEKVNIKIKKPITHGQKVVLSIWAENFAGLFSSVAKVTAEAIASAGNKNNGFFLIEKHSCDLSYCTGECTCAVVGKRCGVRSWNSSKCNEYTGHFNVEVNWGLGQANQFFSASSACLSSRWSINDTNVNILRYEWSVGLEELGPGEGIFDKLKEHVWYDMGKRTTFTYCLQNGKHLDHHRRYMSYIRVWTSPFSYSTFKSRSLVIDQTPPSIRRGLSVIDSSDLCRTDLDFSSSTFAVTTCFNNVFTDQESGIKKYLVKIGTNPEGDDIIKNTDVGLRENITWTNLTFIPGTKYFSTVTAYNNVGLQTSYSSDGFVIDNELPYTGVVFNTEYHMDRLAQSSSNMGSSFHGFDDHHSFIKEYYVAISNYNSSQNVMPFRSVGMQNSILLTDTDLNHGQRYKVLVKAVDAAGYESDVVSSSPILIDKTPPLGFKCQQFNMIENATVFPDKHSLAWIVNTSKLNNPFKVEMKVISSEQVTRFKLFEDDNIHMLALTENADGSLETVEWFMGKDKNISFQISGESNSFRAYFRVIECNKLHITNDSHNIKVTQTSSNKMSVSLNVYDPESGIRNVYTGVGSTKTGLQVQPLQLSPSANTFIIDINVEHGTPVFVTALVENNAGLTSKFSSNKLSFDHSPPVISNVEVTMRTNMSDVNETLVRFDIKWSASDIESGVKHCECGIGKLEVPNMIPWTIASDDGRFTTKWIHLEHGYRIYAFVRCTNQVELRQQRISSPFTVDYLPPDSSNAEITFSHQEIRYSNPDVQRSTIPLQLGWTGFRTSAGISRYDCRIFNTEGTLIDWNDVGLYNHAVFGDDVLKLRNGESYTVEVRAISKGGIQSTSVNKTILIVDTEPQISGTPVTYTKSGKMGHLDWSRVFVNYDHFRPLYIVSLGTSESFTDILWNAKTEKTFVDFDIDNASSELFVVITASYGDGLSTVYKQRVD